MGNDMELRIEKYQDAMAQVWDRFVLQESMNGTFLQTRRFIEYHPAGKFKDSSLIVYKGNAVVAVILACDINEKSKKTFFSHKGTTFGGILLSPGFYSASNVDLLMTELDRYWSGENYDEIVLKMTAPVFCRKNTDLIDYFLYQRGFEQYDELNYYMKLDRYQDGILEQFSSSKRRDYRYSLKNDLTFSRLDSPEGIRQFYDVLCLNLNKLKLPRVHQYEELLDLKFNRFPENIEFYGVYKEEIMIAGSMIFLFRGGVMHTQYLASDEKYLSYFPMDFLIYHLLETALEKQMKYFTFGICTEDHGKYLNLGLSRFKEGFGTEFCIDRTYYREINRER